jgi:hypothetical protein
MTNILYGVNGEGAGHSSRAREMLTHLKEQGHTIHVVSFDRGLKNLASDFEVTEIFGLRLATLHNRVRYGRTVLRNLLTVPSAAKSVHELIRLAEEWRIQLVITDFEPMSCHTGHKLGLPVLSIDNQHCLTYGEISYPSEYRKEAAATKIVTRLMTPNADAYFVTSFFSARPKNKRTFFFPPYSTRSGSRIRSHRRRGRSGLRDFSGGRTDRHFEGNSPNLFLLRVQSGRTGGKRAVQKIEPGRIPQRTDGSAGRGREFRLLIDQ